MPLIDMPLAQLKEYRGVNPCPADFSAFWDASLAQMRALDPQVEYKAANFSAPGLICQELYFTGMHGVRVQCNFVRPAQGEGPHPGALFFHGYTGAANGFLSMLPYAYAGFYCLAMAVRGQGGKSQDTPVALGPSCYGQVVRGLHSDDPADFYFRDVFLDAAQAAGILMAMPQVDENRVGALGGSQGGGLTLACAALEPRIAVACAAYPFLSDYRRVWDMDLDDLAYIGLRKYFRVFDPLHEKEEEIFYKLGYVDVQNLSPRIKARVLMATGLMDVVCPPSTQFAAYNKITSPKQSLIYPDYGHENLPLWNQKCHKLMMTLR